MTQEHENETGGAAAGGSGDEAKEPANQLARRPAKIAGVYMALAGISVELEGGQTGTRAYVALGYYRGNDEDHVRRQVLQDAEAGHQPLVASEIREGEGGAILRAVPARSWPAKRDATRYERGPAQLVMG